MRMSSSRMRSLATRGSSEASRRTRSAVEASMSKPSSAARRTARNMRSGSSPNAPSLTARIKRRSTSARPPNGSTTSGSASPLRSVTAMALTVKSRSARSSSSAGARRRRHVHVKRPTVVAAQDGPAHVAGVVEDEEAAVEGASDRPSQADAALGHDNVQIMRGATQQIVAHGSANEPGGAAPLADVFEHAARWLSRGRSACSGLVCGIALPGPWRMHSPGPGSAR